ncbi:ferredoxin family protein [Leptospira interrogans serovar Pomona]|nr:ferredoxin family protein [Leptospira interrogans serovar Pomona]
MRSDNKVNVDVKLGVNNFYVDEGHPHISLCSSPDMQEFNKLIKACPAGLYKLDEAVNSHFDAAGWLECGTCRVRWGNTLLEKGEYPAGTFGVEFRYG